MQISVVSLFGSKRGDRLERKQDQKPWVGAYEKTEQAYQQLLEANNLSELVPFSRIRAIGDDIVHSLVRTSNDPLRAIGSLFDLIHFALSNENLEIKQKWTDDGRYGVVFESPKKKLAKSMNAALLSIVKNSENLSKGQGVGLESQRVFGSQPIAHSETEEPERLVARNEKPSATPNPLVEALQDQWPEGEKTFTLPFKDFRQMASVLIEQRSNATEDLRQQQQFINKLTFTYKEDFEPVGISFKFKKSEKDGKGEVTITFDPQAAENYQAKPIPAPVELPKITFEPKFNRLLRAFPEGANSLNLPFDLFLLLITPNSVEPLQLEAGQQLAFLQALRKQEATALTRMGMSFLFDAKSEYLTVYLGLESLNDKPVAVREQKKAPLKKASDGRTLPPNKAHPLNISTTVLRNVFRLVEGDQPLVIEATETIKILKKLASAGKHNFEEFDAENLLSAIKNNGKQFGIKVSLKKMKITVSNPEAAKERYKEEYGASVEEHYEKYDQAILESP